MYNVHVVSSSCMAVAVVVQLHPLNKPPVPVTSTHFTDGTKKQILYRTSYIGHKM